MSKRRQPGEIVRRLPGSGFLPDVEPELVKIPLGEESDLCMLGCGDPKCQEWPNLLIISGPFKGDYLYHISECLMANNE